MSRTVDPDECGHPVEERELRTIDEDKETEVCTKCGAKLPGPFEALSILRRERGVSDTWNPEAIILALLGAFSRSPIHGKTSLVKEAFLLEREVLPEIGLAAEDLEFYPHKYGPTSDDIYDALEGLEEEGLVRTSGGENDREDIRLTDRGEEIASDLLESLDTEEREILKRKRLGWDQLGHRDLLLRVYHRYPAFAEESEIREYLGLEEE